MPFVPKKVFVGLSGGVDSSVSAALLKEAGYDVTGVFIRVWQPDFFECTWKDDRLDAMRICAKLSIPFVELDLEKEYKKEVVDYMIREYKAGKTPNPDVMCNRFIKFGGFYNFARKNGADFVATGHYARIAQVKSKKLKVKSDPSSLSTLHFTLCTGLDASKDQSYFLWQIRKEQLPHILFPVGGMQKTEVRKLAKKYGLITADKKDSQGLCFIGKVDMKDFLRHYIKEKPGNILNEEGETVGKHNGAFFYTLGERVASGGNTEPLFVATKDAKRNTITVSPKSPQGNLGRAVTEVVVKDCNWLSEPKTGKTYEVRTRYRQPLQPAKFMIPARTLQEGRHNSKFIIQFASPQTVAPGQSLVMYDGDVCMGGAVMV